MNTNPNYRLVSSLTETEILDALAFTGSINKAAIRLNVSRTSLQDRVREIKGKFSAQSMPDPIKLNSPMQGNGIHYWIFSSAQDRTDVDQDFLKNLEAYADYLGAEIMIGGFTYMTPNREMWSKDSLKDDLFHPSIAKYMTNRQHHVGRDIIFCGEQNTLPTAVNPLSGFETYTKHKWGIFPHPRVTLQSVPTMLTQDVKINMTTGCVTKPNYIQKKAGIKAEFHHVLGAVIVAIDEDGDFFCRHLIADSTSGFQDLDAYVNDGVITTGERVEALNYGDIHTRCLDEQVAAGTFGYDMSEGYCTDELMEHSMTDVLRPHVAVFNDINDFRPRNHHERGNPHAMFKHYVDGLENVEEEIIETAEFMNQVERPFMDNVVVEANHDQALEKWLREADYRNDPVNAVFFLTTQLKKYCAIAANNKGFILIEEVLRDYAPLSRTVFLKEKDSVKICYDIEIALHGHSGANGSRGTPKAFARMGSKANTGHTHSANIFEGIYTAGTCTTMLVGYNEHGLSSWSHSHIVTYTNGKRAIVTMRGSKWREGRTE